MIEKCEVKAGSVVTFDNLFTSLPLLDELTELGIGASGTLRQNRFHGAPVVNKTTRAKKLRITCNSVSTAQRWSKSAKKGVDVPVQNLLNTTTSKLMVLIFSISLCQYIEFVFVQRNGGDLSLHGQ